MSEKPNPYLHERFEVEKAADALAKTAGKLRIKGNVEVVIRSCSPTEISQLAIEEMGCKDVVGRKYCVTLSCRTRDISQSQLPLLQKFGKAAGMVLLLDPVPSELPELATHPPTYRVRVSFVAYANVLA